MDSQNNNTYVLFSKLVSELRSPIPDVRHQAAEEFRRHLSNSSSPPIPEVIASGAVPLLIEMLKDSEHPRLQNEACWAISNIASGTTEQTQFLLDQGCLPSLVALLDSKRPKRRAERQYVLGGVPEADVRNQSMWAISNIAGDKPIIRDYLLTQNILKPILYQISVSRFDSNAISFLRTAAWTLCNFCRGKPFAKIQLVMPALECLVQFLLHSDFELLYESCWAFAYISEGKEGHVPAVISLGIVPIAVKLLSHPKVCIQAAAVRVIGNIVSGDEDMTQNVINSQALAPLRVMLGHSRRDILKLTCWVISNIMAGTQQQIQAVIDQDIVPCLLDCMSSTRDIAIRREACWAISNAIVGGSYEQIEYLISVGAIQAIYRMLETRDYKCLDIAMTALSGLLYTGSIMETDENPVVDEINGCGLSLLESLQDIADIRLAGKACNILDEYFYTEDDEIDIIKYTSGGFLEG